MANYKIVISGYYGFNNAGDEAMLSAIIQSLRSTFDTPEITVISGSPAKTSSIFDVKAIPRFGMLPIIKVYSVLIHHKRRRKPPAGCDQLEKHDLLFIHHYAGRFIQETGLPLFTGDRTGQIPCNQNCTETCP